MKTLTAKFGITVAILALASLPVLPNIDASSVRSIQNELVGTKWMWVGSHMRDERASVPDPGNYTLEFVTDSRVAVQADCNKGTGTYKVAGSNITFSGTAMTLMACQPGSLSSSFAQSLSSARTYKVYGGRLLTIELSSGLMMYFVRAESASTGLVGTTWNWNGTQTPAEKVTVPDPTKYTLRFMANGTVQVKADCNQGSGSYTVDGNKLTFGPNFAMTQAMCPPGSLDTKFMQSLAGARTYKVEGNNLAIGLVADSGTMLFTGSQGLTSAAGLVGPKWYWLGTQSSADPVKVAQPIKYTLEFLSNGTVNVKADCNTGSGTYKVEGNHITFGPIGMTRMACPPGSQDTQFLQGLSAVRTFEIDGNNMMFVLNNGSAMLYTRTAPSSD
jgi:heat shock protein HslJ